MKSNKSNLALLCLCLASASCQSRRLGSLAVGTGAVPPGAVGLSVTWTPPAGDVAEPPAVEDWTLPDMSAEDVFGPAK